MSFNLRKTYGFSKKAAEEGVRMVVGADPETDWVLIKRLPNDSYKAKLSTIMLANKKQLDILKSQDEKAHAAKDAEIFCEVLAETILVGWGSGFGEGDEPTQYSVEAAQKLLLDYPDFRSDVVDFATTKANYPLEPDTEDIKKN